MELQDMERPQEFLARPKRQSFFRIRFFRLPAF